ncbi:MAG TPA: hypothetical protein VNJ04_17745 [Gemmatimonadaceae bacterium]|nr:hypothetical protein [Gemmatimonadaceae bacterium]
MSPDGKWLYFTKNDGAGGVWRMPIESGDEARVIDSVFRYNFAIGKDGVFWVPGLAADRTSSIRFLDTTTGVATELIRIEKPVDLGLSISPDGRTLLFTQLDYASQDLMLVEKFR